MDLNTLSPELVERARSCTSVEEVFQLAQEEGHELSDDELEGISGGAWLSSEPPCQYEGKNDWFGDAREDIDPALVPDDFVNGLVDGGELD